MASDAPDLIRDRHGSYTSPDDPGEPVIEKPRVSITEDEAKILSAIAAGRSVFEIGTGLGVSTRALARWAHVVVTHDIDPWVHENVWPDLPKNVVRAPERLDPSWWSVSLVFIDGNHATDAVLEDIEFARSLEPQLIVLHDAKYDNVRRAILTDEGRWDEAPDWTFLDTHHGLAFGR